MYLVSTTPLPAGFEALGAFLDWNLSTPNARQEKRLRSTADEIAHFYQGGVPWLGAILAEIDRFPLGEIPATHIPLFNIALSLAEIAPSVELYRGSPGVPYAFEERRFVAVHGEQPTWQGKPPMDAAR